MAVNETIVTGRYFRRCTDAANKVWQRISFWHKASDCEFDDNKNAQTKVGAIKGITTSTSVTETGYAADMTTVKNLQTQIDELNSNLRKINKLNKSVGVTSAGVTSANIKITEYTNYKNITIDNIFVQFTRLASYPGTNQNMTYSYNASTGTLTITSSSSNAPFRSVSNDTVQFTVIIVD